VTIFNGKKPYFLAKRNSRAPLNEQQIKQNAHQLVQCCRGIASATDREGKPLLVSQQLIVGVVLEVGGIY
jgi:hypothetical protein